MQEYPSCFRLKVQQLLLNLTKCCRDQSPSAPCELKDLTFKQYCDLCEDLRVHRDSVATLGAAFDSSAQDWDAWDIMGVIPETDDFEQQWLAEFPYLLE